MKALLLSLALFFSHLGMTYAQEETIPMISTQALVIMFTAQQECNIPIPDAHLIILYDEAMAEHGGDLEALVANLDTLQTILTQKIEENGLDHFCNTMLEVVKQTQQGDPA